MKRSKQSYFEYLKRNLPVNVDRQEIMQDLENHFHEGVQFHLEQGKTEQEAVNLVLNELGDPHYIVTMYQTEDRFSAGKTAAVLVAVNILFFLCGSSFIYVCRMYPTSLTSSLWHLIQLNREEILMAYSFFWMCVGFYLGYRYGVPAKDFVRSWIKKPLLFNYFFMLLILFNLIPQNLFGELLSSPFVILCVIATILFAKLAEIGCQWGTRHMKLD